jgi:hypothetical protein
MKVLSRVQTEALYKYAEDSYRSKYGVTKAIVYAVGSCKGQPPCSQSRVWTTVVPVLMILCILMVATGFTSQALIETAKE